MRKILVVGMLLLLATFGVSAETLSIDTEHFDARVLGLGTAYTALADDANALYLNPSGLRRHYRNTMSLRIDARDSADGTLFGQDAPVTGFLVNPEVEGEFLYTTRNWGIALYSKYFMHIDYGESEYTFDVAKYNSLLVGLSTGIGPISLGANLKATKLNRKTGVDIPVDDAVGILLPFLQEIILGEYNASLGAEEQVLMGVGALIDLGNFSIGAYSDEFLNFMYGDDSEIRLDVDSIVQGLNAGIAYQSDTYDQYGNFRILQFTIAADVHGIGDDVNRVLAIGTETNLRFLEYMQMALRVGFRQDLPAIGDLLFGPDFTEGTYTGGLGIVLPFMKLDAALQVPTDAIKYALNPTETYTGSDVEAQLTFGFAL